MELKQYDRNVLATGGETSSFGMEINGAAFSILSSDIYQHKIAALVREYPCNAHDSHEDAGYPERPIKVTLPNRLNPSFVVEDFGIGMDDEAVRKIFATYFRSTKQQDNDTTGGFGVGAKSAFSYTDSFTVLARKNGIERNYVCFIGKSGIPDISLLSENETNEENGVRVTIPVLERDIHTFVKEARVSLSMMKTRPIVTGNNNFSFIADNMYEQIKEKGFALIERPCSDLHDGHSFYVLVGGVIYPAPGRLYSMFDNYMLRIPSKTQSMVVEFPIGTIYPAVSRETLQMKGDTSTIVLDRFKEVVDNIKASIDKRLETFSSTVEAARFIVESVGTYALSFHKFRGSSLALLANRVLKPAYPCSVVKFKNTIQASSRRYLTPASIKLSDVIGKDEPMVMLVWNDGSMTKSKFEKAASNYIRNKITERQKAITFSGIRCKSHMERVVKYLGGHAVIIDPSELTNYVVKSVRSKTEAYDRGEKKRTTVYAKSFSNEKVHKIRHVETLGKKVFYAYDISNMSTHYGRENLERIAYILDIPVDDIVIVELNAKNKKAIDELGIMPYSSLVEQIKPLALNYLKFYADMEVFGFNYYENRLSTSFSERELTDAVIENSVNGHRLLEIMSRHQAKWDLLSERERKRILMIRDFAEKTDFPEGYNDMLADRVADMDEFIKIVNEYEYYRFFHGSTLVRMIKMHDFCVQHGGREAGVIA